MGSKEERLLEEMASTVARLKELHDLAYTQYSQAVDAVLEGKITDEKIVEQLMDGIIDLGDDVRFIELSKKLHRFVFFHYPQLVGSFGHLFRSLFEESGDEDGVCDR